MAEKTILLRTRGRGRTCLPALARQAGTSVTSLVRSRCFQETQEVFYEGIFFQKHFSRIFL